MIHVIATVQINPGQRAAFLAEFRKIVEDVRAEAGCIEYGPAVDFESRIPVQAEPRPDVVTIIEKWESSEALSDHLRAPHMVTYRERVRDLVKWVDLRILEPA
ncbi:MAG: putative quinol monooxygenase [Planctomycetaceae bacterium]